MCIHIVLEDKYGMVTNVYVDLDITLMILCVFNVLMVRFGIIPRKLANVSLVLHGMGISVRKHTNAKVI